MDEYQFITLAKLKADRLRLEREHSAPGVRRGVSQAVGRDPQALDANPLVLGRVQRRELQPPDLTSAHDANDPQ